MKFTNLGIVIPLKAKSVSADWGTVCSALQQTIDCVLNQSSQLYECVVVGHDKPEFLDLHKYAKNKRLQFIYLDELAPPDRAKYQGEELQLKYEVDRCTKITKGMLTLYNKDISHWYALDADDLIHRDMIKSFENWDMTCPIIFDNGYFLYDHLNVLNKTQQFSLYCGSCCIIPSSLTNIPQKIDSESYRQTFFGQHSHCNYKSEFEKRDIAYFVPQERLVIYARSHGENISLQVSRKKNVQKILLKVRNYLGIIKNYTSYSNDIREKFSIDSKK